MLDDGMKSAGPASGNHCNAGKASAATDVLAPVPHPWWPSWCLLLASATAWVASIPILIISLGGSLQPHVGWVAGIGIGLTMFGILVQAPDQRVAAYSVLVVSFLSAASAGNLLAAVFATVATAMTFLNAVEKTLPGCPSFVDWQCKTYGRYHKVSEIGGALSSIQPGNSFFACHPHGILSIGWAANTVWNKQFHHAAGRCMYLIDSTLRNKGLLARLISDVYEGQHGGLRDNSAKTLRQIMSKGESVCMIPGAYQEATMFSFRKERVVLRERMGFVKYCLRFGYRLHPVYTFGESETYRTVGGFEAMRLKLNKLGIPTVIFWGLSWCPLLPRRNIEMRTFVGEPLEVPRIEEPTDQDVEIWHAKYIDALKTLFDKHKVESGCPDAVLEVL